MIYIYELATLNRIKSKNATLKKKGIKGLKIVIKDLSDVVERKKNTQASLKKEEKGYSVFHVSIKRHSYNERGGSYNGPPFFVAFSVKRGNLYCESRIF